MASKSIKRSPTDVNTAKEPKSSTPFPSSHSTIRTGDVFYFLVAFRLLNALAIFTFFQPDEYYQSLEPAWWFAFGDGNGAWITWEWKNQLRSALHPALFSILYRISLTICQLLNISSNTQVNILLAVPKVLQAFIAAIGDYYTFKLARQIYGKASNRAWLALVLSIGSAWQWFCSTRTFSNCLETMLTTVALYNWPYQWALEVGEMPLRHDEQNLRARWTDNPKNKQAGEAMKLRRMMLCAAFAVILRPTNVIIWITLTFTTFRRGIWHREINPEMIAFVREGIVSGGTVLVFSGIVDRMFYSTWTFPAWNFLQFNVFQSIAVFYGNNNWHYYLSQGYPLLLTTAVFWAGQGLYEAMGLGKLAQILNVQSKLTLHRLAVISLVLPAALSILSHKEVRFIYPILPALHILAASPFAQAMNGDQANGGGRSSTLKRTSLRKLVIMVSVFTLNVVIAGYATLVHGSGVVTVVNYLRNEFETHYQPNMAFSKRNLTFAAFMPCHSTPWRSHLQYPPTLEDPGISGWALTCEPPLNLSPEAKAGYLDEADIFYNDPAQWMLRRMSRRFPPAPKLRPGVFAKERVKSLWTGPEKDYEVWLNEGEGGDGKYKGKRAWPDYLLFFEQLEPVMNRVLEGSAYVECARFFNSHAQDDWRRKGDILVWCLFPDRALGNAWNTPNTP